MKRGQKVETKLYELLGIKLFRKAVFRLEKIVHRKDHGKNTNYHIQNNSINSVEEFKKYLYYNGTIHTSNLIKGIPLVVLMVLFNMNVISISLISLLLLKDLYCVMLQRYNWIKLSEKERSIKEKQNVKIANNCRQYGNELVEGISRQQSICLEKGDTTIRCEEYNNNLNYNKIKVRRLER